MQWWIRLQKWLFGEETALSPFATAVERADADALPPIHVPIGDEIDLHTFKAKEARQVVSSYLEAATQAGYGEVRVVHGKGKGILKKSIRALLKRDPHVVSFKDAPPHRGGWGATIVYLRQSSPAEDFEE